jgi:hypothetical protein
MEIPQYKTEKDAEEFVNLLNLFHSFYKREYDLPPSANFFDKTHGLKEMQEFKKQCMESGEAYFKFYEKKNNEDLLKKYKKIYHLTINGHYSYTSSNVIKIITNITSMNISNWDIFSESITSNVSNSESITSNVSNNESITSNVSNNESITSNVSNSESSTLDVSNSESGTLDVSNSESGTLDVSNSESIILDASQNRLVKEINGEIIFRI